jgi:hypothetical protein
MVRSSKICIAFSSGAGGLRLAFEKLHGQEGGIFQLD